MTTTSAPLAMLSTALVQAQASCAAVEKGNRSGQGYKYASAENMISEARVALNSSGLALLRVSSHVAWGDTSADGKTRVGSVFCDYLLVHTSGESLALSSETPAIVQAGRPDDKAVATALTYSLGYFLRDLLLLPRVEEGTDVDQRGGDQHYTPPPPVDYSAIAAAFSARIMGADSDDAIKAIGKEVAAAKLPPAMFASLKDAATARRKALEAKREPGEEG